MKIVLSRIDERLIHGQVMTAWLTATKARRIIIIDDSISNDGFMKQVLMMAAPSNVEVIINSVKQSKKYFDDINDETPTILLFKHPNTVLKIVDLGIPLREIEIGNMSSKPTRYKLCKMVYINKEEEHIFNQLNKKCCTVFVRMLPNDNKRLFDEVLK